MTTRFIEQSLLRIISMEFRSLWRRRPIREASPTLRNEDRRLYSQATLACTDGVYGLPIHTAAILSRETEKSFVLPPSTLQWKTWKREARQVKQNYFSLSGQNGHRVTKGPLLNGHWKTVVWSVNVQLIYCQICYSLFNYICCIYYFAFCAGTYRGPDVTCRWEELRIGQRSHFLGNRFTL